MNTQDSSDAGTVGFVKLQDKIDTIVTEYLEKHPGIVVDAVEKDAALKGKEANDVKAELSTYPGVAAIAVHEVAHELYKTGNPLKKIQARALAEAGKSRTGIDIHPGTEIGKNCFIDHGTGDVIGETAKIGNNSLIYHGVTLGAYGHAKDLSHRHPEIGDDCVISSGTQVLGHVRIGNNVKIGPAVKIWGNDLKIGDDVRIGINAEIGDGNTIKKGVRIGMGSVIADNVGVISENVPAYSIVSKTQDGELLVNDKPIVLPKNAAINTRQSTPSFSM